MYVTLILLILLFLGSPVAAVEHPIWIDADPACGLGMTDDVDDCWALVAAIRSSDLRVLGVSTVFGNVSVEEATVTTQTLFHAITMYEPSLTVPEVHQGAKRRITPGVDIPLAVTELETALTQRSMTILALGPLTNVAIVLTHRPDLIPRIKAIVAVAGQRPGQVFRVGSNPILHFHDLNVAKDPDSFDIVLRSGVPIHLIPFELGRQVVVTRTDLATLKDHGYLNAWIAKRSTAWLDFWERVLGAHGFAPFDTLAVAYVVDPRQFSCQALLAKIIRRRGLL